MAEQPLLYVTLCVTNPKALRALMAIQRMASEIADDQPWNDTARKLEKAARYLARHSDLEMERE